jgi:hypothetical protein
MSRITHSSEALALLQQTPLTIADLLQMGVQAADHSFLAEAIQDNSKGQMQRWAALAGLPLPSRPR